MNAPANVRRFATTVVYLCPVAPSPLGEALTLAGFDVYESLSGSEVLHLLDHRLIHVVVVAPGIEDADLSEIQQRAVTIQLEVGFTAEELVWELSHLVGPATSVH